MDNEQLKKDMEEVELSMKAKSEEFEKLQKQSTQIQNAMKIINDQYAQLQGEKKRIEKYIEEDVKTDTKQSKK